MIIKKHIAKRQIYLYFSLVDFLKNKDKTEKNPKRFFSPFLFFYTSLRFFFRGTNQIKKKTMEKYIYKFVAWFCFYRCLGQCRVGSVFTAEAGVQTAVLM